MNLRVKFGRLGPVKYLGHLDMMRYFQKALLRADIDMKYSAGYNPHQIMSFAYPLGVAMETEGDYMDIEVNSYESLEDITNRLNSVMHEGIYAIETSLVPDEALNAMASVAAARYRIGINKELLNDKVNDYLGQKEIIAIKDGKKGPVEKDIKAGILEMKVNSSTIEMLLTSGSVLNVKPADVINTFNNYHNESVEIISIKRVDIYRQDEKMGLVPLGVFG